MKEQDASIIIFRHRIAMQGAYLDLVNHSKVNTYLNLIVTLLPTESKLLTVCSDPVWSISIHFISRILEKKLHFVKSKIVKLSL